MRLLKHKISIVSIVMAGLIFWGCDNDDEGARISLDARFVSTIDSRTVSFINISSNANRYSWDFGNGMTSTLVEPVISFDNGTYTVTLTAFDENGNSDRFQDTIVIDLPVCTDETDENIDPANGNLNWTFLTTDGSATFDAFGDTAGFIVENPVIDDVNPSCNVQRYEKTAGCASFAGLGIGLSTSLNFFLPSTNKVFKMKVLAETQITDVTLRLEFMPFPNTEPSQERVASITELGQWQELTFDFSDVITGTYQSMIIYFERGATCDGDIYYFDDIIQQE